MTFAQVRKSVAALGGAVLSAISLGLISDPWDKWISVLIGLLTTLGVYVLPNEPLPAPPSTTEPPL
jgi:hypothetical protein